MVEKFIVATEKSWWIIFAITAVLCLFLIIAEVLRRTKFKEDYIKYLPLVYIIEAGLLNLIFSLMLVWWLALPVCVASLCLARMHEKTDVMLYFRKKGEKTEDYKPYMSNLLAICSSAFISYIVGVIVQFYFEL